MLDQLYDGIMYLHGRPASLRVAVEEHRRRAADAVRDAATAAK